MAFWRHLTHGLRVLTRRAEADRDLADELQHYLDESVRDDVARGLTPEAARRAARRGLQGGVTATREHVRAAGWEHVVTEVLGDIRLALRMLARQPLLTCVIVLVIALGSGAVATIYSAMNALVLRPVPGVADPEALVALQPMRRDGEVLQQTSFSRYTALRANTTTLDGLAVWGRVALTLSSSGQAGVAVFGNMVSANYFDVLGVRPAAGRLLAPGEDTSPGANPLLVASHDYWQTHLDGDHGALGQTIAVNGHPFTLIGVAPPGFHGVFTGMRSDAWVPVSMQPQLRPRSDLNASWLWMFGRLAAGQGAGAVAGELSALTEAWARDHGGADGPQAITAMHVSEFSGLPGGEGRVVLAFTGVLLAAAMLVLAIAGINVATMLSARYVARQREMAVRAALGAGRGRLLRHLLTEVLVLFLLGAIGGFLVAVAATTALERLPLPANVPVSLELSPDLRVLAFALGVTMLTGLVFGLPPALRTARRDNVARLRDDSARAGMRRGLLGRTLVVGQLALSLVLLVCAGLFVRALGEAARVDPGFDRRGVVATTLEPESWGYDEPRARDFYARLQARVEAIGGVSAVGLTARVPLMMGRSTDAVVLSDERTLSIDYASVGSGYFDSLRLPLLQGRALAHTDDASAPRVAVINESLARRAWPGGDAIGQTMRFRDEVTTIVGIARDAKYAALDEETPSFIYVPLAQVWHPTQTLLARSGRGGADADVMRDVRKAVLAIDPSLPPPRVTTLERATDIVLLPQRAGAIVTAGLGAAGLLLASVGLYGLMAFTAGRRTRELGIRVALGATRSSVLRLMLSEGLRLAGLGIGVGLVLAALAARALAPYLFSVSPFDPLAFLAMTIVFLLVAIAASFFPARRAATADPLEALRSE